MNSAADAGLFGPAGKGGNYSEKLKAVLGNCPNCGNGTALTNRYRENADAYFAGAMWPWVCSSDDDSSMIPYTGSKKVNCYCDNEPQNGRGADPIFPYNTKFVYCGLFGGGSSSQLTCDLISLVQREDGTPPISAVLEAKAFELTPASF